MNELKQVIANDLVKFLAGKWANIGIGIAGNKEIATESYLETMVIKDQHTITITAHEYKDGNDLTKDMHLKLEGNVLTMAQGPLVAKGRREGNVYLLSAVVDEVEYRFRLYTMEDKFLFHRETWKNGSIVSFDFSYLVRQQSH